MTRRRIDLEPDTPHQRFQTELSGELVAIELHWLTEWEYFRADIYDDDGEPITLGRGLHPDQDLLAGTGAGLGKLYLEGRAPTVANLGEDNRLIHEPED